MDCSTVTDTDPTSHKFITSVTQENGKISVGSHQPDAKDITYTAKAAPSQEDEGTIQYALDSKLDANNWLTEASSDDENVLSRNDYSYIFPTDEEAKSLTIATREWVQNIKDNYYTKSEIDSMLGDVSELLAKLHSNKPNGGIS